ncbi:hypothetical protein HNP84_004481 [Thermocatellispora tengchongensis]|uniref:Uncharacterized protein n=1 Tax=Thermocatellispora tengchongensis TaxID=1073253 RepID=A0A840PC42_9ACTN|nr:hypothetical protein [Thermocatellispora tengchongensis]MBB5134747.1 hypothetical protein [Thermocatellispora tengchongensis]
MLGGLILWGRRAGLRGGHRDHAGWQELQAAKQPPIWSYPWRARPPEEVAAWTRCAAATLSSSSSSSSASPS